MVTGRGLQVYCQQGIQRPLPWVSLFDHLDPLSISPRCSVRVEQASLHQQLPGPLVLFWVWPMESPREDQRWEEKEGAIFCPLAPLWVGGVPELKVTAPATSLSTQPLPSLGDH